MMRKGLTLILSLLLYSSGSLLGQDASEIGAQRIDRYEGGASFDEIMEANWRLSRYINNANDRAAVRVCSKEPLPVALSIAAMNPFRVAKALEGYNFSPERVMFLRSEDCRSNNPLVAATELWIVPTGATLPASVESIKASQAHLETVGKKDLLSEGARNYRAATQELTTKLYAKPGAVGVVLGYYYKQPSRIMKRRLREVCKLLEQSGLPKDRYFVRLAPWTGEYSDDDPEPKYPSLLVVEVARDNARR